MDPHTIIQVLFLALLQGVTELFPVSSLGHTVLIPGLLGWGNLLQSDTFLPLLVMLHLGTATALLTFFWRDWVKLLRGGLRVVVAGKLTRDVDPDGYGRQLMLVIVGTVPAGLIGVILQKPLENNFSYPIIACAFLAMNGAVLMLGERLYAAQRRKQVVLTQAGGHAAPMSMGAFAEAGMARPSNVPSGEIGRTIEDMTFMQAILIGSAQAFALIPGISRSGITMAAGMASGLSHEASARFTFLLATPIIAAAGALEVPKLLTAANRHFLPVALVGGLLSGIAAYLSVRFLMRYFETNRLTPFAYYCLTVGVLGFGYFLLQYLHILP